MANLGLYFISDHQHIWTLLIVFAVGPYKLGCFATACWGDKQEQRQLERETEQQLATHRRRRRRRLTLN